MRPDFWRGKRVFLTGHTGFKGSWLSLWLQMMGAHVTGYALPAPTDPSLFVLSDAALGMHSVVGDIRNGVLLRETMAEAQPEVVIHMAAQPLVRYGYQHPVETYEVNVLGTVHLFEAIRSVSSVRAVVNVTTDKCYENKGWVWGYREGEPLGGHDPYSSSKACSELVSDTYRRSFFEPEGRVRMATARAGNVIGGGDWAQDRLLPDIVSGLMTGNPICIRYPKAIRPWQHVLEPLRGYLSLAESLYTSGVAAQAWNFGPDLHETRPVSWIVERMVQLWGSSTSWTPVPGDHPHEAHYLRLDISKAADVLKWHPRLSLADTLTWIVTWYKGMQAGGSVREITLQQIEDYQKRIVS